MLNVCLFILQKVVGFIGKTTTGIPIGRAAPFHPQESSSEEELLLEEFLDPPAEGPQQDPPAGDQGDAGLAT